MSERLLVPRQVGVELLDKIASSAEPAMLVDFFKDNVDWESVDSAEFGKEAMVWGQGRVVNSEFVPWISIVTDNVGVGETQLMVSDSKLNLLRAKYLAYYKASVDESGNPSVSFTLPQGINNSKQLDLSKEFIRSIARFIENRFRNPF